MRYNFTVAPVAQLDRVPDFESVGWEFESPRGRQMYKKPHHTPPHMPIETRKLFGGLN